MKKAFYWGLVCVMGLSLFCSCSSANQDRQDENNPQKNQSVENNDQENPFQDNTQEIRSAGTLCSIQQAYELGWVTRDDIMEICYRRFGEVWTGEDCDSDTWVKCDYTPAHEISELDETIESDIKKTYYKQNEDKFIDKDGIVHGGLDNLSVRYFGEFNDLYVVLINCSAWDSGAVAYPVLLAGVAWWESGEGFGVFCAD